jgi:hypothetical protein
MKRRIENRMHLNKCIPKETMIGYIDNTLDKNSFLNVCAHLESCEYCSEAFKGLNQLDDFSMLNSLPVFWQKRTGLKAASGISSYVSTITRVVVSLAIVISCVVFFNNDSRNLKKEDQISGQTEFLFHRQAETSEERKADESTINNHPSYAEDYPEKNENKLPAQVKKTEPEILDKIARKEVFVLNKNDIPDIKVSANHRSSPSEIIYLENLKTINCSKKYSGSQTQLKGIITGVIAQYENYDQQSKMHNESGKYTYAISYEQALSNGLRNFNNGLYRQAIADFDIILRQFPKDLNCKFYKALCYENTENFEEAGKLFSETMNDFDDSFFEEAKWHFALSKIKLEKIPEAKYILKQIISDNGFYKAKAETMLIELK